jgi:Glycerophosphoryl diester phosphodiesterase family
MIIDHFEMKNRHLTTWLARAALFFGLCTVVRGEPVPLPRAHAHNDYAHQRPLFDALDHGFCSVEADIYLRPEGLLIGHDAKDLQPGRTLEKLYLDPLRERVKENGGAIYRGGPMFWLLIDVKTEANESYAALDKVVARYADILSVSRDGKFERKAVTVVLSGNRAIEIVKKQAVRYVGIDGRPEDLPSNAPADLIPWISANWTLQFKWTGNEPLPAAEKQKLDQFVRQAHDRGRLVRFWATPEKEVVWKELNSAGVDLINTDKLDELQKFLLAAPAASSNQ